jgi:(S)-2-hydroxyglutarate dehydrogenase
MNEFDIIIIGGGIVGLSTAFQTRKAFPGLKVAVLEKENHVASHQTGNNSGVIHSGIYYKPGSLKAINCKKGYHELIEFCDENNVDYEICGKIIVTTKPSEKQSLENIYKRGVDNGLEGIRKISAEEAREIEPHVKCIEGIWVPQTGIIDYKKVTEKYLELFKKLGGDFFSGSKVNKIISGKNECIVLTDKDEFKCKVLVNCAGLYSDKITKMSGSTLEDIMIIPFRGEYYELKEKKRHLVKNLIYPVPNPDFPFLGVHFTRMINGGVEAGPNAVLAFRREGYTRWDINFRELFEILAFPGFRKVASKYWDEGWMEMKRSFSKKLFVKAMQELIPEITGDDVYRSGAGVRAQACDAEGGLLDDFKIIDSEHIINVCNAPSPAATSSLAFGKSILNIVKTKL